MNIKTLPEIVRCIFVIMYIAIKKTVHKNENKDQNSSCPLWVTLCRLRYSEIKKGVWTYENHYNAKHSV